MSLRYVASALLLFTAAAGWSFTPISDGEAGVLQSVVAAPHFHGRTLPLTCVLLAAGSLVAGRLHRSEREDS